VGWTPSVPRTPGPPDTAYQSASRIPGWSATPLVIDEFDWPSQRRGTRTLTTTTRGIPVLALAEPDLSEADRLRLTGKVIGTVPRSAATSDGLREWVDLAMVTNSKAAVLAEGEDA